MKKPSPTAILRKRNKSASAGIIWLRIHCPHDNQRIYISLGLSLPETDWDSDLEMSRKTNPKYKEINATIQQAKQRLQNKIDSAYSAGLAMDKPTLSAAIDSGQKQGDFITLWAEVIKSLESANKAPRYIEQYKYEMEQFKAYVGGVMPFSKITAEFVQGYQNYLSSRPSARTNDGTVISNNTVFKKMSKFNNVVNIAIKRGLINSKDVYGTIAVKYKPPKKDYLTFEDVEKWEQKLYAGEFNASLQFRKVAANFLMACCSGIRISDWGKWDIEETQGKRFFRVTAATKNKKPIVICLDNSAKLARVVEYIQKHKLRFDMDEQTTRKYVKLQCGMCGIEGKITPHSARHSFGFILGVAGYNDSQIAQLLGITPTTARVYVNRYDAAVKSGLGGI